MSVRLPSSTITKSKYPLESQEQRTAWSWLSGVAIQLDHGKVWTGEVLQDYSYMVPNGTQLAGTGKRRAIQMTNLKAQGLRPGVSDIVIAYPVGEYHGAYIEMKRVRASYGGPAAIKSAVRPEQVEWLIRMRGVGYWCAISYGAEDFRELVTLYLRGKAVPDFSCFRDDS